MTVESVRAASVGSGRSRRSHHQGTGYRTSSERSFVDESLFGKSKSNKSAQHKREQTSGKHHEMTTVTRSQLEKMKAPSSVMSPEELQQLRKAKQEALKETRDRAQARKERMIKMEEERKKHVAKTETEVLQQQEDKATLSRAKHLFEEELDDVKNMNQMMLYSKCVTIRDAQIEEKKHMMLEAEEESRRLDLMMEIERLKALENYEVAEVRRAEERKKGAEVLAKQIEERSKERIKQEELINQERSQMLKEIERLKEEEVKVQMRKKDVAVQMMEEVAQANAEQIKRKEVMKIREKEEDERIAEYIHQKDLREEATVAEKERIAKEKELETARLRAQQEKAADKQAELDELRARRYQEAKEREWRARELAAQEHQTSTMHHLAKVRESQKAAKIRQLADMARVEQREFQRVLDANRKKEKDEVQQVNAQIEANLQYKEELLAQVSANGHRRSKARQEQLEEGRKLLQTIAEEKSRLEHIKHKKLKELESCGVPSKYTAELQKKKVGGW